MKAALTRKLGPLPAWAWLGLAAVGVWLWQRHAAAGAAGTTATPTDSPLTGSSTDTGTGSGSGFDGGSSGGGDGAGGLPLTPPQSAPPTTPPPAAVPDPSPPPDPAPPDGGAPPGARVGKLSQPASQSFLHWGGHTFTTQAGFAAWAKAHGTTVAAELAKHPEAAAIYGNLAKPAKRRPTMLLARRSHDGERKAKPPHVTPASVRSAPSRPGVRAEHEPVHVRRPRTRSSTRARAAIQGPIEIGNRFPGSTGAIKPPALHRPPQGRRALPRGFGYRR